MNKIYGFATVSLFIALILITVVYSYTQVDLNLTLSTSSFYLQLQKPLTQLGYFNRPLSGSIFLGLFIGLFIVYGMWLWGIVSQRLHPRLIKIGIITSFLLVLGYAAFSYDLFNYLFDARITTYYGLDPHYFKALDFPFDPLTRFMRWTHRYYPYGPGWLLISLIPSWLGMGKFILTMFLFKGMFALFHAVNLWLLHRLLIHIKVKLPLFWLAVYAFNPLVLIESLVSPHNEVVMLCFTLFAFWLLIKNKVYGGVLAFAVSLSIKYISAVLTPLLIWRQKIDSRFFTVAWYLWIIALIPVILMREVYSWYFIPIIAIAALGGSFIPFMVSLALSGITLIRYYPFLLLGEYSAQSYELQLIAMVVSGVLLVPASLWLWQKKSAG
ncbi:MAG: hypothetical protein UV59_C0004G0032 [Candidatus Gottesmanbacteria bacterium GW2011_GWA1_43_11]|uniref:Uncharacterized protein n=1 Tax=Candidatus Gottesmanbacteria bacterium GW2011_GWA1_43_11 TaxID=1618436 RepID=A0A0G1CK59_9BACT|nr:MAG: hypothetical protein UV59_C0004G0032 [Candidatus Gottesmanbacteria bacterium GW2011_GWA1_43_11]